MVRPRLRLSVLILPIVIGCQSCAPTDPSLSGSPASQKEAKTQPAADNARVDRVPDAEGMESVLLDTIPHIAQKPDFCGEACVEMVLQSLGSDFDQDEVFGLTGLSPEEGRGAWTRELKVALDALGFEVGTVWNPVAPDQAGDELMVLFGEMHADLMAGIPSIVCMHYDAEPETTEHFRLIIGYDADTDEVIYHEPAEARGAKTRMTRAEFIELWPLKYRRDQWTAIRFRLAGEPNDEVMDASREASVSRSFTEADYSQHVQALKERLAGEDFTIVVEPPFVVIGDESEAMVRRRAKSTVRWATSRLKDRYFERDPDQILDVWLFGSKRSYMHYTKVLFGDEPGTPYGYYSEADGLVMNIATGGGTLVHEIVHPFMDANFPECPSWFNEGLASLYEQSAERDGGIVGLTNWRLEGLQEDIDAGVLPAFEELMATTTREFYDEDPGSNYGQARYLMYYLQEQGKLEEYYETFTATAAADPTGVQSLKTVLGRDDLAEFQVEWEAWVMGLTYN